MEARSSNAMGRWVHFGGDVAAGVEDGIGVILRSASTGSAAVIEPLSDSDTAALVVRAKGAAALTLGNSSNALNLVAPRLGANSTTAFALVEKYTVEFTPPSLAATTGVLSTYTVTGLTTNSVLVFTPRLPISPAYSLRPRCSTANELVIAWGNLFGSTIGTGESTNRGTLLAFNF